MPSASQERLKSGFPLLEYGELIDPSLKELGILSPQQIPIHPKVYLSPETFTPEFAKEVWANVPDSIRADLTAIETKTGIRLPIGVDDSGVRWLGEDLLLEHDVEFDEYLIDADPKEGITVEDIESIAVNIGLNTYSADMQISGPHPNYPLSKDKLARYMVNPKDFNDKEGIITWYVHNLGLGSTGSLLVLRNFAIMFNNLGLQKIGPV